MSSKFIYWFSDGVGVDTGDVPTLLKRWMQKQPGVELIVYGGDVYDKGAPAEFELFKQQMDNDLSLMCETPGNHDWKTTATGEATGLIPSAYENFWAQLAPPLSKQPIDPTKQSGARYEHFIDVGGWRLVFLDTGLCESEPWPMGDQSRVEWLDQAIGEKEGRAKIVFAHHSRLSRGVHGDMGENIATVWDTLFDENGKPRVAMTVAGHDHTVSIYGPRPHKKPEHGSVAFDDGIYVVVNGAGGGGHYKANKGTVPDLVGDHHNYCVTQIEIVDEHTARVSTLSFGSTVKSSTVPTVLPGSAFVLTV